MELDSEDMEKDLNKQGLASLGLGIVGIIFLVGSVSFNFLKSDLSIKLFFSSCSFGISATILGANLYFSKGIKNYYGFAGLYLGGVIVLIMLWFLLLFAAGPAL